MQEKQYCDKCDKEVNYTLETKELTLVIRNTKVTCEVSHKICNCCGSEIFDMELEDNNVIKFYDTYKELNGLLSRNEIKKIRKKYGISQQLFSKILGFNEYAIEQYEQGYIQDKERDDLIRSMAKTEKFKLYCLKVKDKLNVEENNQIIGCLGLKERD